MHVSDWKLDLSKEEQIVVVTQRTMTDPNQSLDQQQQQQTEEGSFGDVDHLLLESLFYNEIALLEDDWTSSMLTSSSTSSNPSPPPPPLLAAGLMPLPSSSLPNGPTSGGTNDATISNNTSSRGIKHSVTAVASSNNSPPTTTKSSSNVIIPNPLSPTVVDSVTTASQSGVPTLPLPIFSTSSAATSAATTTSHTHHHHHGGASSLPPLDDAWKRQILVSQFATLAERLGITIPSEIIGKLQQPAEAADQSPETPPLPHEHEIPEAMAAFTATPPTTAAVAAITTSATSSSSAAAAAKQQRTSPKDSSQRRRKKPRLHDCQVKLANLREENERLKRHLDVIQNRSQKILKERANTEQTLRTMMENGASDDQLAPLIDAYSEAHSDYGKKRFEELQFHLDQLQVLATPTDFTKMGLWALAGNHGLSSSTKPKISNLLQTELDITDAQSRKILEQRQKIRMVCANHKEVRLV
jgi:hypothetical protein